MCPPPNGIAAPPAPLRTHRGDASLLIASTSFVRPSSMSQRAPCPSITPGRCSHTAHAAPEGAAALQPSPQAP
eukprot:213897-Alexandrium_andersonii.AAC.2